MESDRPESSLLSSPFYIDEYDALSELLTEDPTEISSDPNQAVPDLVTNPEHQDNNEIASDYSPERYV